VLKTVSGTAGYFPFGIIFPQHPALTVDTKIPQFLRVRVPPELSCFEQVAEMIPHFKIYCKYIIYIGIHNCCERDM